MNARGILLTGILIVGLFAGCAWKPDHYGVYVKATKAEITPSKWDLGFFGTRDMTVDQLQLPEVPAEPVFVVHSSAPVEENTYRLYNDFQPAFTYSHGRLLNAREEVGGVMIKKGGDEMYEIKFRSKLSPDAYVLFEPSKNQGYLFRVK